MKQTKYTNPINGKTFNLEMVDHANPLNEKEWIQSPIFISDDCLESLIPSQTNLSGKSYAKDINTLKLIKVIL